MILRLMRMQKWQVMDKAISLLPERYRHRYDNASTQMLGAFGHWVVFRMIERPVTQVLGVSRERRRRTYVALTEFRGPDGRFAYRAQVLPSVDWTRWTENYPCDKPMVYKRLVAIVQKRLDFRKLNSMV